MDEKRQIKEDKSSFSSTISKSKRQEEDDEIIKWICVVLAGIGVLIYYVILYFTVFDKSEETERYLIK